MNQSDIRMRQNVCRRLSAARRRQKYEPGLRRAASKRTAGSSDSISESSLRSTPGPRDTSLPPSVNTSIPSACGQDGGSCVSPPPHSSSEARDGDCVVPPGKKGKKRPSSQLLLPGEGTPAKVPVRVSPAAASGPSRCHGLRLYPVCVCNTVRLGQDTT